MLVDRVVQLINQGVTGMDLLEVFLSRRIQPLQARDHLMWMYSGANNTARVHPEEVSAKTVAGWLKNITGNKNNPREPRGSLPLVTTIHPTRFRLLPPTDFLCILYLSLAPTGIHSTSCFVGLY